MLDRQSHRFSPLPLPPGVIELTDNHPVPPHATHFELNGTGTALPSGPCFAMYSCTHVHASSIATASSCDW